MKYLEELKPGDLFEYKNQKFILTNDYKQRKNDVMNYSVVSINDGSLRWLDASSVVNTVDLYTRDVEGNILLVKEFKDEDNLFKNKNVS